MKVATMSEGNAVSVHASITDLDALTADIVSAFVGNNAVPASDLPNIIRSVRSALGTTEGIEAQPASAQVEKPDAAAIKKSIQPDALISFIDGKPYKTLKRHLRTNDLTPETYRQRYGLPVDYPMVSASYSAQRSELAKQLGLGQMNRQTPAPVVAKAPSPRRRKTEDRTAV